MTDPHIPPAGNTVDDELAFHEDAVVEALLAQGWTEEAARAEAQRRFGDRGHYRRELERLRRRRQRRLSGWARRWLAPWAQDARYAARRLRRSPGFAATIVLTLSIALGLNAAMFHVVDGLMFRPPAYLRDPGTVHRLYWQSQWRGRTVTALSTEYTRFVDLQRGSSAFTAFAAFSERPLAVGEGESLVERQVGVVTASFFDFFDARPERGRFFRADEDLTPRGADVVVLSHAFWQSQFGGRDVLGTILPVGDVRATIIGVAPEGFNGMNDAVPPVAYVPMTTFAGSGASGDATTYFTSYTWGWVNVLVRRRASVSRTQAEGDATRAFRRSWDAARSHEPGLPPVDRANPHVVLSALRPGGGPAPSIEARTALSLTAVAGIVLLIACANVGNLLLARALGRRRETAVQLALGIGRPRLATQSALEMMVLAAAAGAGALLVGQFADASIRRLLVTAPGASIAPQSLYRDSRTLLVTAGLVLATGLLTGVLPALMMLRGNVVRTLRGGVRGGQSLGHRLRATLLVVQATLCVCLLAGATLFVTSLRHVNAVPMGYEADRVLLVTRVIRGSAFDAASQAATRRALLGAAEALPEVEAAAWVSSVPFASTSSASIVVDGVPGAASTGTFTYQATTPGYFRVMRTRVLRGRALTDDDRAGSPAVAVISASMARALWPDEDALGRCFRMGPQVPCLTVIGIAEDIVQRDLAGGDRFHFYVPIEQLPSRWGLGLVLRLRADPAIHAEAIRTALQRVMPAPSYVTTTPLQRFVDGERRPWQLGATMFVAFGLLAVSVATVGLYSVVGYHVAERRHELGVRAALGARRPDIVRLMLRETASLALAGIALGTGAALAASRWVQPLLFEQSARDPRVYVAIAVLMMTVAIAAGALPAWRAAKADPNRALRAE
jgi:predicted permease